MTRLRLLLLSLAALASWYAGAYVFSVLDWQAWYAPPVTLTVTLVVGGLSWAAVVSLLNRLIP